MQDTGNGVGSLFAGGSRLKPNLLQGFGQGHQGSLKCPRCGSLNTKFCYYNNYNLSQPRFFCKGCRRYWTKGGVLRNVPVGGRSRKTKRSKQKSGKGKPSSVSVANTCERKSSNSQNSSSESSVAAANISLEMAPFTPTEAVPTLFNQIFEPPMLDQCPTDNHHLFSEIGAFRSLDVGFPEISSLMQQRDEDQVVENQNWNRQQWLQVTDSSGLVDKRSEVDEYSRSSNGGDAAEDWGLFDQSYWLNNLDHQLL